MEDFSKETPSQGVVEREHYVAVAYRKLGMEEELRKRWAEIKYQPAHIQLKLNLQ